MLDAKDLQDLTRIKLNASPEIRILIHRISQRKMRMNLIYFNQIAQAKQHKKRSVNYAKV